MISLFTRDLLQAVSDWQRGGSPEQKARRGGALKKAALVLPRKFRQCRLCYRQIALEKSALWNLADTLELPETISAWTQSLAIARAFKGGVPPQGSQGIIFLLYPSQDAVIVNLGRLYQDTDFQDAISKYKDHISGFHHGMGRYGNSQNEVVVEVNKIRLIDIHELGGFSMSRDDLVHVFFGPNPTASDYEEIDRRLRVTGQTLGPGWIGEEQKDRVIAKIGTRMPVLRAIKRLQEAALPEGEDQDT